MSPDVLYHYTTATGLKGIIESESLWATDADFLNDAQELRYGREELRRALVQRAHELSPPGDSIDHSAEGSRAAVMLNAAEYLGLHGAYDQAPFPESIYVTCFCDHGDLLSQWRGYGRDGGYALGLSSDVFRAGGWEDWPRLIKVHYGHAAVEAMLAEVLPQFAPKPVNHPGASGWASAVYLATPALASVKHDAFAEEREWRLIVRDDGASHTRFRAGAYGLIPFIETPLPLDKAIREVVIGPGQHAALRAVGVRRLLRNLKLDNVEVRISDAPFRG